VSGACGVKRRFGRNDELRSPAAFWATWRYAAGLSRNRLQCRQFSGKLAPQWGTMHSTSPTSDLLTSFKSARWAASGWWLRSSKRVIEERRAVLTLLARADEVIE
jgi:hypothetical protein